MTLLELLVYIISALALIPMAVMYVLNGFQ